jgi:hypothetical protein
MTYVYKYMMESLDSVIISTSTYYECLNEHQTHTASYSSLKM